MSQKIDRYIQALFEDVPRTKKALELKEELLGNMRERYEDYLRDGKSDSEAYSLTVASMGDLDEMIAQVMPDEHFRQEAQYYRRRSARNTAIAAATYILGAAIVVASALAPWEGVQILAMVILLVLVAGATALLIYTEMSTPVEYREEEQGDRWMKEAQRHPGGQTVKAVMNLYWIVVTTVYLVVSFLTAAWGITWIIWPLAGLLSAIIRTVIALRWQHE